MTVTVELLCYKYQWMQLAAKEQLQYQSYLYTYINKYTYKYNYINNYSCQLTHVIPIFGMNLTNAVTE